jgi:co-chaperonin GroES (HSP10)
MDGINIELNGRRVLVELEKPTTILKSGIIIPDSAKMEKPTTGIVKKISTDITDNEEISVNDRVFFKRNSCTDINIDGKPYALILIDSIIAKLEENEQ